MVPFLDLKTQYLQIREEILAAVTKVLDSTQFVLGSEVKALEEEYAAYVGAKAGIGVNSGTSALHLALLAGGVKPGDEVITVPHTFVATVAAIRYIGAKVVFVDIDPDSYTLDPGSLEAAIGPKTKAIMPVHLYGQPADMDPILEAAKRHGVLVVEDAAQAHGAKYKGRGCGSMGDLAGFSFYPGKNMGAYGEGGMVTTSNADYARTIRMLRDWGQEKKYHHDILGFNARMEGIQGAVLRVKLKYLEQWTENRRRVARQYDESLADAGHIVLPKNYADRRHVYHIYAVRVKDREGFMKHLADKGVQSAIHYPFAVHTLKGYADLGYVAGDFPVAERVASEVVSLPMYPEMTPEMVQTVIAAVKDWSVKA
jgi:dTDP-4-amino-4,6-dideoxygalactose transaminase